MGSKYAFIVAYTDNYFPGIEALRNSVRAWMPHVDMVEHHGISIEDTAIRRFAIACEEGTKKYDAICLMDADMFLTADCTLFFDVAAAGFIVTGSNGMIIDFNKAYQDHYGIDLGVARCPYPKVHTTVPIFLSARDLDWFSELYNSRRVDHWDDFLYLNLLGIKIGKDKKMIVMPPYAFTGIHHWQLKPAMAAFERSGMLLSGTEERVYMVHGKWWDQAWLQDLEPTMNKYLDDENIGQKGKWRVFSSIELLKSLFENARRG